MSSLSMSVSEKDSMVKGSHMNVSIGPQVDLVYQAFAHRQDNSKVKTPTLKTSQQERTTVQFNVSMPVLSDEAVDTVPRATTTNNTQMHTEEPKLVFDLKQLEKPIEESKPENKDSKLNNLLKSLAKETTHSGRAVLNFIQKNGSSTANVSPQRNTATSFFKPSADKQRIQNQPKPISRMLREQLQQDFKEYPRHMIKPIKMRQSTANLLAKKPRPTTVKQHKKAIYLFPSDTPYLTANTLPEQIQQSSRRLMTSNPSNRSKSTLRGCPLQSVRDFEGVAAMVQTDFSELSHRPGEKIISDTAYVRQSVDEPSISSDLSEEQISDTESEDYLSLFKYENMNHNHSQSPADLLKPLQMLSESMEYDTTDFQACRCTELQNMMLQPITDKDIRKRPAFSQFKTKKNESQNHQNKYNHRHKQYKVRTPANQIIKRITSKTCSLDSRKHTKDNIDVTSKDSSQSIKRTQSPMTDDKLLQQFIKWSKASIPYRNQFRNTPQIRIPTTQTSQVKTVFQNSPIKTKMSETPPVDKSLPQPSLLMRPKSQSRTRVLSDLKVNKSQRIYKVKASDLQQLQRNELNTQMPGQPQPTSLFVFEQKQQDPNKDLTHMTLDIMKKSAAQKSRSKKKYKLRVQAPELNNFQKQKMSQTTAHLSQSLPDEFDAGNHIESREWSNERQSIEPSIQVNPVIELSESPASVTMLQNGKVFKDFNFLVPKEKQRVLTSFAVRRSNQRPAIRLDDQLRATVDFKSIQERRAQQRTPEKLEITPQAYSDINRFSNEQIATKMLSNKSSGNLKQGMKIKENLRISSTAKPSISASPSSQYNEKSQTTKSFHPHQFTINRKQLIQNHEKQKCAQNQKKPRVFSQKNSPLLKADNPIKRSNTSMKSTGPSLNSTQLTLATSSYPLRLEDVASHQTWGGNPMIFQKNFALNLQKLQTLKRLSRGYKKPPGIKIQ